MQTRDVAAIQNRTLFLEQPLRPTQNGEVVALLKKIYELMKQQAGQDKKPAGKKRRPGTGAGPDVSKFYRTQMDRVEDQEYT